MGLTPAVVLCATRGLQRDPQGRIQRRQHIFAKLSRPEVAEAFMSPAPSALLEPLVRAGKLSAEEAALAAHVPVAEDITAEADSGGHTDNRPLAALLPVLLSLRDRLYSSIAFRAPFAWAQRAAWARRRSGRGLLAGRRVCGDRLGKPSRNRAGLAEDGKRMLAEAGLADVMMAPCADMFELGSGCSPAP